MLALLYLAGLLGPQTSPVPTFPAAVELVTVDAVVLDDKGNPVPGLTRDDFVVTEDGRRLEIAGFEAFAAGTDATVTIGDSSSVAPSASDEAPRSARAFGIVLDDLTLTPANAESARRGAATFLERHLRDGDEVALGTTSGDAWWSASLPGGGEDLLAVLARVKGRYVEATSLDRMSEYEAYWINSHESGPPHHAPVPDRPGFVPSPQTEAAATGDFTGVSRRERVKERWKQANLCPGTSCDSMVRDRAAEMNAKRLARTRLALVALRRAVGALAPVRGRKSLLFLSEAMIDESSSELTAVVAAAREANTAIYFIDVRGLVALVGGSAADAEASTEPGDRVAMDFESRLLETRGASALAEETGGYSVRNTNDFTAGAGRIAEESRVYYLLGFYPPEGKDVRKWRKLEVEVKRPGLTVRARRGYSLRTAASLEAPARKKGKPPTLAPAVVRALDSAHNAAGIPLRAGVYLLEPRPRDTTKVLVAAELDAGVPAPSGPSANGRRELSIVVTQRDTGREFRFDGAVSLTTGKESPTWRALTREFDVPAGVAQLRVVVRDPASGALGSVSQRFQVPAGDRPRISTPILTDRLEPGTESQSHPRPALAVHRVFAPTGRLYCQFEVFGAAGSGTSPPRVWAGLELRTSDGRIVQKASPTLIAADRDGRVVRLLGLPLEGLAEGAYELVLEVRDEGSGARLAHREAFRLGR